MFTRLNFIVMFWNSTELCEYFNDYCKWWRHDSSEHWTINSLVLYKRTASTALHPAYMCSSETVEMPGSQRRPLASLSADQSTTTPRVQPLHKPHYSAYLDYQYQQTGNYCVINCYAFLAAITYDNRRMSWSHVYRNTCISSLDYTTLSISTYSSWC